MAKRLAIFFFVLSLLGTNTILGTSTIAKTTDIDFLQGEIDQQNVENLGGLACRNYDHIVHLNISIDWSDNARDEETTDYKRLIFWNDSAEYLFPNGSYFWLHGAYVIDGYFIPRRGAFIRESFL